MNLLVTGGAGYIGSHAAQLASSYEHQPIVYDNLSTSSMNNILFGPFIKGDVRDTSLLLKTLLSNKVRAVLHSAAVSTLDSSTQDPRSCYDNNVRGLLSLLEAMKLSRCGKLIFSSSCAVYGVSQTKSIAEGHSTQPVSTYGKSKLVCEDLLREICPQLGIDCVILRYFNAAGADPSGKIGESHDPETHIIPLAIRASITKNTELSVYGDDYRTFDGSCIRDYVHVSDLAEAQLLALQFLQKNSGIHTFNIGSGVGYSVFEILSRVGTLTGNKLSFRVFPRRQGDPDHLVSDSSHAKYHLGWTPKHSEIDKILTTAYLWQLKGESVSVFKPPPEPFLPTSV
jgi:UDP-glucose-4-epimerase GalE